MLTHNSLGHHFMVDFHECDKQVLLNKDSLAAVFKTTLLDSSLDFSTTTITSLEKGGYQVAILFKKSTLTAYVWP